MIWLLLLAAGGTKMISDVYIIVVAYVATQVIYNADVEKWIKLSKDKKRKKNYELSQEPRSWTLKWS